MFLQVKSEKRAIRLMRTKRFEDKILEEQKRREEEEKRKKRDEEERKKREEEERKRREEEELEKEAERKKKEEVAAALAAAKCKVRNGRAEFRFQFLLLLTGCSSLSFNFCNIV